MRFNPFGEAFRKYRKWECTNFHLFFRQTRRAICPVQLPRPSHAYQSASGITPPPTHILDAVSLICSWEDCYTPAYFEAIKAGLHDINHDYVIETFFQSLILQNSKST